MTQEYKTLRELNVKPGDVVEHCKGFKEEVAHNHTYDFCKMKSGGEWTWGAARWRIVSRASDTPKLWRDMTPEEKGALLLAHHEGKVIECHDDTKWYTAKYPLWDTDAAYRVRPEPKWKLEYVSIVNADGIVIGRGTVITENGKPDCNSIKMEEL
jgi:hypothetical protein